MFEAETAKDEGSEVEGAGGVAVGAVSCGDVVVTFSTGEVVVVTVLFPELPPSVLATWLVAPFEVRTD